MEVKKKVFYSLSTVYLGPLCAILGYILTLHGHSRRFFLFFYIRQFLARRMRYITQSLGCPKDALYNASFGQRPFVYNADLGFFQCFFRNFF